MCLWKLVTLHTFACFNYEHFHHQNVNKCLMLICKSVTNLDSFKMKDKDMSVAVAAFFNERTVYKDARDLYCHLIIVTLTLCQYFITTGINVAFVLLNVHSSHSANSLDTSRSSTVQQ